jgi:HK97 gp10 family phage protein
MFDLQVGISGRAALMKQLDDLKRKASKEQLEKALIAGGEVFKAAIVERTPHRTPGGSEDALPPGALKRDIQIKVTPGGKEPTVLVGPGENTAQVMRWLEWGHRVVSRLATAKASKKTSANEHVPAHPVMRPAYEASRDASLRAVIQSLKDQEG